MGAVPALPAIPEDTPDLPCGAAALTGSNERRGSSLGSCVFRPPPPHRATCRTVVAGAAGVFRRRTNVAKNGTP